jgi:hypothetical protein
MLASSRSLAWQPVIHSSRLGLSKPWHASSLTGCLVQRSPVSRQLVRSFASTGPDGATSFRVGDEIQVEVVDFGPLGASVEVIGLRHGDAADLLPADDEPHGTGLILQKEIAYFRSARNNVDVVRGEILPAFVQNVREDGKLDVGLRAFGGKAKAQEVGTQIMDRLKWVSEGTLPVGDKSSPEEINREFPGVSKSAFKKAIGALYKKGSIKPSPNSITIVKEGGEN